MVMRKLRANVSLILERAVGYYAVPRQTVTRYLSFFGDGMFTNRGVARRSTALHALLRQRRKPRQLGNVLLVVLDDYRRMQVACDRFEALQGRE
jgi:hypothetical protein